MKLSEYMREQGYVDREVAEEIGVERSHITKLKLGTVNPSIFVVDCIEQWSGGMVTFKDFVEQGKKVKKRS